MAIELKILKQNESPEWDTIIENSIHGTIFHRWDWLKIVEKHTNGTFYPIIGLNNTEPIAAFPLFVQKKYNLNMVFSPPPHVGMLFLGPVFREYELLKQDKKESYYTGFQKEVDNFLFNDISSDYNYFALPPNLADPRPFQWADYEIIPAYDYEFDVKLGKDVLWENLKKNARTDITRARKKGITIEIGHRDEFIAIYKLLQGRYRDQKRTVNVPLEYLLDIYNRFQNNIKILVAKYDGELITGSVKVYHRNTEYSWIGSPKPSIEISPSPNPLITWEEISHACDKGLDTYLQMGTAGNHRLSNYFTKFNPNLKLRFIVKKRSRFASLVENGYLTTIKPLKENLNSLFSKDRN
ncbi:GNAT family N-acetyltransferase [Methanocalculus sp.]|uniref:GNAT family N-acetyltransferase n=1 Tax=Methanocalculus sp. TaxID=2004547 RepID=UPI0026364631|nr:GNAT family N-acetyltransferase [Methanocalculus sp.]MDG6251420.1 GNAT family N-acetyltransferase [Methanocalculus sp.]